MRLNTMGEIISEVELLKDLQRVVGTGSKISFKYYTEIPVLSSGKRRYIVNEFRIK